VPRWSGDVGSRTASVAHLGRMGACCPTSFSMISGMPGNCSGGHVYGGGHGAGAGNGHSGVHALPKWPRVRSARASSSSEPMTMKAT
jgi:hypothetical protein